MSALIYKQRIKNENRCKYIFGKEIKRRLSFDNEVESARRSDDVASSIHDEKNVHPFTRILLLMHARKYEGIDNYKCNNNVFKTRCALLLS